ncbi:metallophosphoesterase [Candidatus Vecturithrix granuli]|uniref:Metallophosphoesterase n=1 Tax=Vecturithrix granuli TaxID=1499967 RepID=A0A081CAY1_VECG1|nr:metallophosphoesterase [Candidatus Vecturithrix granuli]
MESLQETQPMISVRGGFLKSFEHHVAVIRALGFQTQIKIFHSVSSGKSFLMPLTILLENVRGDEVQISHQGGTLCNVIRSQTSMMFDVYGADIQKIHVVYPYQREEFDFVFFGDVHGVFNNLEQIIQTTNTLDPLFVMANGDMTHSGRLEDYHNLLDIIGQSEVPFFTSIGNHDRRVLGGRAAYRNLLAPMYYSFSVNNTTCIVLDSSRKRGLQRFQYKWLERELQLAKHQRILVFLHRPPICPKYNYLAFSSTPNARRFMTLMERHQVEMVFGSHIHVFTEFQKSNVRYVVTGGGGGALWQPANVYHYLHVFVKKDGVEVRIIPLPTPEAKMSQRLKDVIKFNLEYHLTRNKHFKQVALLGTTLLLSRNILRRESRLRPGK